MKPPPEDDARRSGLAGYKAPSKEVADAIRERLAAVVSDRPQVTQAVRDFYDTELRAQLEGEAGDGAIPVARAHDLQPAEIGGAPLSPPPNGLGKKTALGLGPASVRTVEVSQTTDARPPSSASVESAPPPVSPPPQAEVAGQVTPQDVVATKAPAEAAALSTTAKKGPELFHAEYIPLPRAESDTEPVERGPRRWLLALFIVGALVIGVVVLVVGRGGEGAGPRSASPATSIPSAHGTAVGTQGPTMVPTATTRPTTATATSTAQPSNHTTTAPVTATGIRTSSTAPSSSVTASVEPGTSTARPPPTTPPPSTSHSGAPRWPE